MVADPTQHPHVIVWQRSHPFDEVRHLRGRLRIFNKIVHTKDSAGQPSIFIDRNVIIGLRIGNVSLAVPNRHMDTLVNFRDQRVKAAYVRNYNGGEHHLLYVEPLLEYDTY